MTTLEEMMKKIERKPTFHERAARMAKKTAASLLAPTIFPIGMAALGTMLYGIPLSIGYIAEVGGQKYLGHDGTGVGFLAAIASVAPCLWASRYVVWALDDLGEKIEHYSRI